MKKMILPAFLALFALFTLLPHEAHAAETQEKYALISENDVYLYANDTLAEEDKMCILPKTYYVRIEEELTGCYSVTYMNGESYGALFGYVKKSQASVKAPKASPYYFSKQLEKIGSPKLYTVSPDDDEFIMISAKQQVYYYGDLYDAADNLYYYVSVAGRLLGYVSANSVAEFEIPIHPDSVVPPSPSPNPSGTADPSGQPTVTEPVKVDDKLQILLIVAICIPAIIIVFLLFRGGGKPPKSRHRDNYARINYPPYDKANFRDPGDDDEDEET